MLPGAPDLTTRSKDTTRGFTSLLGAWTLLGAPSWRYYKLLGHCSDCPWTGPCKSPGMEARAQIEALGPRSLTPAVRDPSLRRIQTCQTPLTQTCKRGKQVLLTPTVMV